MNPKRRATVGAACLVVASAFWSMERSAAQSPEVEPPPSVAVIDQRLLETAQDQSLDDTTRANIRGLYQQALAELEAAVRLRVTALDFSRRTTDAPTALGELDRADALDELQRR